MTTAKANLTKLVLTALSLTLATACGSGAEKQDGRSHGTDDINVKPRKVHGSDATGQTDGAGTDGAADQGVTDGDVTQTDGSGDGGADGTGGEQPLPDVKTVQVQTGMRNYEQIYATMSAVTGVPRTNTVVRTAFTTQLSTSLPTDNDIKAFIGSQQVAVFKLAVEFCDTIAKDTANRGAVFGTLNFAAAPATALDAAGKQALADALVTKFWGKDLESLPPLAETSGQVVTLIDQLLQGKVMTNVAATAAVATSACTAVLASAPVTMF